MGSYELTQTELHPSGARRILDIAAHDLMSHDAIFRTMDKEKWQTEYSLFYHHELDRQIMELMCYEQRLGRSQILLSELAALVHDTGKIDKECWAYRLNRKLSHLEKMAVDTHGARTGTYINRLKRYIRREDHHLIDMVESIATAHHKPYLIRDPHLRQIGFNLKFADIFISLTENRDRPKISTYMAILAIKKEVESLRSDPRYTSFAIEMERSRNTLIALFG